MPCADTLAGWFPVGRCMPEVALRFPSFHCARAECGVRVARPCVSGGWASVSSWNLGATVRRFAWCGAGRWGREGVALNALANTGGGGRAGRAHVLRCRCGWDEELLGSPHRTRRGIRWLVEFKFMWGYSCRVLRQEFECACVYEGRS